ncbi:MAG: hypothetical protein PHY02_00695 [Phycisphaerae bacterium]|nr:hypothetical protein [Phycisphaerae bacterium]
MIRFKCIYCGQKILSQEDGACKKAKCPKCNHLVVVPRTTKGRPALNADTSEKMQQINEELATLGISQGQSSDVAQVYRESAGWLVPTYDELSLFLMAATFILLSITNDTMREQIGNWLTSSRDIRIHLLFVVFLGGIALSLYHAFTKSEKSSAEKIVMMLFAVIANAGTGMVSGWYVIKNGDVHNLQLIFPIWNIINGVLLLIMLRFGIINEECISDRDTTFFQVLLGLTAVIIIFLICHFVLELYWAITFSICIVYATSFDKALQSVLPGLTCEESEPSS